MEIPTDRRYTETHEWCRKGYVEYMEVGVSQYAADQLTDITFVGLPAVGTQVTAGQPFGEIESVKSAGDLIAPVSGSIMAVNTDLSDDPGIINRDPYEAGWMVRIVPSQGEEFDSLLTAEQYQARIS